MPEIFSGPVSQGHCKTTDPSFEAARCYSEQAVSEPDTLKLSALIRCDLLLRPARPKEVMAFLLTMCL